MPPCALDINVADADPAGVEAVRLDGDVPKRAADKDEPSPSTPRVAPMSLYSSVVTDGPPP